MPKIALEIIADQTQLRSKSSLIRQMCSWIRLWSEHPHTEVTSDHTILRSNQIPDPVILV